MVRESADWLEWTVASGFQPAACMHICQKISSWQCLFLWNTEIIN
jgi:hypothetical protein